MHVLKIARVGAQSQALIQKFIQNQYEAEYVVPHPTDMRYVLAIYGKIDLDMTAPI